MSAALRRHSRAMPVLEGLSVGGRWAICLLAAAATAGCVVGPNYAGPPAVVPRVSAAPAFARAGDAVSDAPAARWWVTLGDSELDRLVTSALARSPDIEAARARLRQSRAILRQNRANGMPTSSATALALRSQGLTSVLTSGSSAGRGQSGGQSGSVSSDLDIYSAGLDATWELDLFGGERRAVEGARADAEAQAADLAGAQVSLAAEVAQAYVALRDDQGRLALATRDVELATRLLDLTRARRADGAATDLDVERLTTQVLSARARLEPLKAGIDEQLDRLAVLTGQEPGALDAELSAAAPLPTPPTSVKVADPGALLRRRPDVRAAERRLARSNALIGQRTADLFPKVTLLGDIGFTSTDIGQLFTSGSFMSAAAPILQWSPLDFGRNQAKIAQARAARDEAEANYRKTVLGALQDAETGLDRYGRQRAEAQSLAAVKASADRAAAFAALRLAGGTATTLDALDAERTRVQAESDLEQAQAQVTQDYVALQKSLGLGWSAPGGG